MSKSCPLTTLLRLAILCVGLGCGDNSTKDRSGSHQATNNARQRLERVVQRYQSCQSYGDRGVLELRYAQAGRSIVQQSAIEVRFVRPNRIRLTIEHGVNQLSMRCDGSTLWTNINDPETVDLQHQVVQRDAPAALTIDELYASTDMLDPANPQQLVNALQGLPLGLHLSQIGLLLADTSFSKLLQSAINIEWVGSDSDRNGLVERIQLTSTAGSFVFHIDVQRDAVVRIDYPTGELFQSIPTDQRPINVQLTLQLHDVRMDADYDDQLFVRTPNVTDHGVPYFVLPPSAMPTQKYGNAIRKMNFVDPSNRTVNSSQWSERLAVLVWFDRHGPSQTVLASTDRIAQRYAGDDRIGFYGICTHDRIALPDDELRRLAAGHGNAIRIVRDTLAEGRDALAITEAPTIVILDEQRRLHHYAVGASPNTERDVTSVLNRLLEGHDVAQQLRASRDTIQHRFEEQLALAKAQFENANSLAAAFVLPSASNPERLTLSRAWTIHRQKGSPLMGNLVVVPGQGERARIMVLNEARSILELDMNGRQVASHSLPLQAGESVTQLRYAAHSNRHVAYLVFAQFGRYVYLLDHEFKVQLKYPRDDQSQETIQDALLTDLDRDGRLELYVGLAHPGGVQRVDLDGNRVWSQRSNGSGVSLCARQGTEATELLVPTEQGLVLPIDSTGAAGDAVQMGHRTIYQLVAGSPHSRQSAAYVGLSYTVDGRLIALGLDAMLGELWAYGLPSGPYRHQVRSPQYVNLVGNGMGYWLAAGPDGSVHLVRDDGGFHDYFRTGCHITGLAGFASPDGPRLLVATEEGLSCWTIRGLTKAKQETDADR